MSVNKITKKQTTELIHDARLPDTLGTAGQMPTINAAGTGFEYGDAGGGTKLYRHTLALTPLGQHGFAGSIIVISAKSTQYEAGETIEALYANGIISDDDSQNYDVYGLRKISPDDWQIRGILFDSNAAVAQAVNVVECTAGFSFTDTITAL